MLSTLAYTGGPDTAESDCLNERRKDAPDAADSRLYWGAKDGDDITALRSAFDPNGDGKLTSADVEFAKLKVMVTKADGSQTAKTLTEIGNTEIALKTDATRIAFADGPQITGQTTFVMGKVIKTAAVTQASEGHILEATAADATKTHVG